MRTLIRNAALAAGSIAVAAAAMAADLKVGLSVSLSGPNSSLGIPYAKGMQAALAFKPEIAGRKVHLIVLDDASDPTTAGRNARKLVEEEKVDVLMGSSGVPASLAMAQVGKEAKVPMIGLSPLLLDPADNAVHELDPLAEPRVSHTATLLPDSRVLIAGGSGLLSTRRLC